MSAWNGYRNSRDDDRRMGDSSVNRRASRRRTGWRAIGAGTLFVLCALALPSATLAATSAQKTACSNILILRGWHPPLALAGDVPASQGVSLLRQELDWQQKVVTATQLDPQVDQIRVKLWSAVRSFNLKGLYNTLPDTQGDWRSLTLRGQLTPGHYRVSKTDPGGFNNPLTSLGALSTQLAMRPRPTPPNGPSGHHFEVRARLRSDVGPIAWADVLKTTWVSLKHLTTAAPIAPPTSGGLVGGTGGQSEILLQLQPAFPATYRWYLSIAAIPNLLAHQKTRSRARHMHITVQLDDGLSKHYPRVADYLEQLKGFISGDFHIQNESGRWLSMDFDSTHERVTLDGWVVDGHLVPSRNGVPQLNAIDTRTSLNSLSFQSVANIKLTAMGVTVKLNDWPFDWQYKRSSKGANYAGRITQKPSIDVSGAALGFIPSGLVDVAIPGNIEGIVNDFMRVLTHSNDGQGAKLSVNYADSAGDGSILSASVDGNTLDNFFVHFAVNLVNKRIIPNSAQFQGLKDLASDGLTAARKDTNVLVTAQNAMSDRTLAGLVKQCKGTQ